MRFVGAGVLNTGTTWVLYTALVCVLHYVVAYTVVYVLGIGLGYLLNAKIVFRTQLEWHGLVRMPAVYLVQYLTGTVLLWLAVNHLTMSREAAMDLTIAVTTPVTFLLARFLLVERER